jgi:hypothetical protein
MPMNIGIPRAKSITILVFTTLMRCLYVCIGMTVNYSRPIIRPRLIETSLRASTLTLADA